MSYCLNHDASVVHAFIYQMLCSLETLLPNLEFCHYYSDGALSQYKNYKNSANLLFHEQDHGIPAEWHFFATSHGKSRNRKAFSFSCKFADELSPEYQ